MGLLPEGLVTPLNPVALSPGGLWEGRVKGGVSLYATMEGPSSILSEDFLVWLPWGPSPSHPTPTLL